MSTKAHQVEFLIAGMDSAKGGTVTFYAAGTTTLKTIWLDRDKQSVAANPYTLDSKGAALLFADGLYKVVVKDAAGATIYTRDNLSFGLNDGPWIDAASYASLTAAVAAIGSTETNLLINTAMTLTGNTTIPATLRLDLQPGGSISQGAYTLTINSPFSAGEFQVFTGTGAVTFGNGSVEYVIPQWWGANTAANINKAINAFYNVVCPPGVYNLETQVFLLSNTRLRGHKSGTIFKRPAGVTYLGFDDAFMVGFSTHGSGNYTARTNVLIEDITVDGNSYNSTDSGALSGIYMHSGSELRIKGCTVKNLGRTAGYGLSSGIVLSWTKAAVVEDNDTFDNTGDGIVAYAYNIATVITRNRAYRNGVAGIELEGKIGTSYTLPRNKSMVVSNNMVYDNCGAPWGAGGTSYGHGILVDFCDDVVITGNTVYNNTIWGGAIALVGNTNVSVVGNSIYGNTVADTTAPGGYGVGVWAQYATYGANGVNKNISISNNTISGNKNGVLVQDTLGAAVVGNTIERTDVASNGIILEAANLGNNVAIRNNIIRVHSGSACIGINANFEGVSIEANQMLAGLYGVALYTSGTLKKSMSIRDNIFDSVTNGIYGFPGVIFQDGSIVGNTFKGTITDALGGGGGNIVLSSAIIEDNHFVAGAINAVWPVGTAPTTGTWKVGDRWRTLAPAAGATTGGWCTVAGGAKSTTRANSTAYAATVWVLWTTGTTVWECTTAGTTAGSPPSIAGKVVGDTVTDGTAVWTMRSLTTATFVSEALL